MLFWRRSELTACASSFRRHVLSVEVRQSSQSLHNNHRQVHSFLFSEKHSTLELLLLRACRSLPFMHPNDASYVLLAIADLPTELPVNRDTLVTLVASQVCSYDLEALLRTFEAFSRLGTSPTLVTAHILKLVLRLLVAQLTEVRTAPSAELPVAPAELSALPCVCDVVLTLQRWHTRHTLCCFLNCVEATLGMHVLKPNLDDVTEKPFPIATTGSRAKALFLFEAYAQCGLVGSIATAELAIVSSPKPALHSTTPFLCVALCSVLRELAQNDLRRILTVLSHTDCAALMDVSDMRECLWGVLTEGPGRGAGAEPPADGSICLPLHGETQQGSSRPEVALHDVCRQLLDACRLARLDEANGFSRLPRLLRESKVLLSACADEATDTTWNVTRTSLSWRRTQMLWLVLSVTREVGSIFRVVAAADGCEDVLHETQLWVDSAVPFLTRRLTDWRRVLERDGAELSRCSCAANDTCLLSRHTLIRLDWAVLVAALDACEYVAAVRPGREQTLVQEVMGAVHRLCHNMSMLKPTLLHTRVDLPIALVPLRTFLVTVIFACQYYARNGALLVFPCEHDRGALTRLRAAVWFAQTSILPLSSTIVDGFLHVARASMWMPLENSTGDLAELAVCGAVSDLVTTTLRSTAARTHVVLHLWSSSSLPDRLAAAQTAVPIPTRLTPSAVTLYAQRNPLLERAVRGAATAWTRMLGEGTAHDYATQFDSPPQTSHDRNALRPCGDALRSAAPWIPVRVGPPLSLSASLYQPLADSAAAQLSRNRGAADTLIPISSKTRARLRQSGLVVPVPFGVMHSNALHTPPYGWLGTCPSVAFGSSESSPHRSFHVFEETENVVYRCLLGWNGPPSTFLLTMNAAAEQDVREAIIFHARLLSWYCSVVYTSLLRGSSSPANRLRGTVRCQGALTTIVADTVALVVRRRSFLDEARAVLLRLDVEDSSHGTASSTEAEYALLLTTLDIALLPGYVVKMLHVAPDRAPTVSDDAIHTNTDVMPFLSLLARFADFPQRHRSHFESLFTMIQGKAPEHVNLQLQDWRSQSQSLWARTSPPVRTPFSLTLLISFLVRCSCHMETARHSARLPAQEHLDDALLFSFLQLLDRGFPLLGLMQHGRFRLLSEDALAHATVSTVGLLVLLDLVTLADPLFTSARLTPEATLAHTVVDRLRRTCSELRQLHLDLTSTEGHSVLTATRNRSSADPFAQIAFLLSLAEHANVIVCELLFRV